MTSDKQQHRQRQRTDAGRPPSRFRPRDDAEEEEEALALSAPGDDHRPGPSDQPAQSKFLVIA